MILAGSTAIVTGGAVRIGREIGRRLAAAGIHVCVHYGESQQQADVAVREFQQLGVRSCAIQADLMKPQLAAKRLIEQATNQLGPVQIIINNAAIFVPGSLQQTDQRNWSRHLTINLEFPFFLSQAFAAALPKDQEGNIVNMVDWRGERPVPGHAAYTISKAGLIAQTKLLAQELGPQIRVNGIAPGPILPAPGDSQAVFELKGKLNPLERTGQPEEISLAVLYLLQSRFTTGEILHVTGGEELGRIVRS